MMSGSIIGDMRQHFLMTQHGARLRSDVDKLVKELSLGQKDDLTQHLGSGQERVESFERRIDLIEGFLSANLETGQLLETVQLSLSTIADHRANASDALLATSFARSPQQIENAAIVARQSFEGIVQALNTRLGDRSLFGGNDTVSSPMASTDAIMDDLGTTLIGLTDASAVDAAIENWFNVAGSGFDAVGYQGDTTSIQARKTDVEGVVQLDIRGDDIMVRDLMKSLAKSIFAADPNISLSLQDRRSLQINAGTALVESGAAVASVQSRIGLIEGEVEQTIVRLEAQKTTTSLARNELVQSDPYETATYLEAIQSQLEMHYVLTARLSRLSLTEYL